MSRKACLFDLDGVLIDSEPIWAAAIRALLAAHGEDYREEVARRHRGMRIADVVAVLRREHDLSADPERLGRQLIDGLLARFEEGLEPAAGAAEALDLVRAQGFRVALASSSPQRVIDAVVARYGWHFDACCSGDEVERGKPAPDLFLLAAQRLFVPPRRCVVVEDSLHGARAAKAAGMFCITVGDAAGDEGDVALASLAALTSASLPR